MIGIMHRNGTVYRFADDKVAMEWLSENPEIMDELTVFSDSIPEGSVGIDSTLYMRQCKGCNAYLKFEVERAERVEIVICPKCNGRMKL